MSQAMTVPTPEEASAESSFRTVNGVRLHTITAGETDDPLVVFLHGFPEFWYEWRAYIEPFVEAGYRVVVPDQRGYNRSEKPSGVGAYRMSELSRDIVELVGTEHRGSTHVIGHDWGAAVAWDIALRYPDTVDRLGIINVPHPTVLETALRSNLSQVRKSWYMFFFQLPRLPEWFSRRDEYEFIVSTMREGAQSGTFSEQDFERYRRAWAKPGALTAMINWYRALFRYRERPPRTEVQAPTQIIWGLQDHAIGPELATASLEHCADSNLEQFLTATHWIPHEYPERVTTLLLEHLESG